MKRSLALRACTAIGTLGGAGRGRCLRRRPRRAVRPPITFTQRRVDWGIKQSFRNYIKGPIAHGAYTASDGATENADGTFRFAFVSGTYDVVTHGVVSAVRRHRALHRSQRGARHDDQRSEGRDRPAPPARSTSTRRARIWPTGQVTDYDDVAFATSISRPA